MPFLLAEILDFQGSAHLIGVGSLSKIIDKDTYETRVKYAIHMIYEEGETEKAEGIAKAHGYGIKKILAEYENH